MEALQRLTRRQLDTLRAIRTLQSPERGASLKELAARLGTTPPSVLGHLTPLERLALVSRHRGKSRLSPRGEACLVEYQRHHRVAENLFHQLGLSPDATHVAALEVDLALSHRTIERLCEAEGHPTECPHGDPIAPCAASRRSVAA